MDSSWQYSEAISTQMDAAARLRLNIQLENLGSAPIKNLEPTLNLVLGGRSIATFTPNIVIEELTAGGWTGAFAVDQDNSTPPQDITLSIDEFSALKTGAPLRLEVMQVKGEVHRFDPPGSVEETRRWAEFEDEIHARSMVLKKIIYGGESTQSAIFYIYIGGRDYYSIPMSFKELLSLVLPVTRDIADTSMVVSIDHRSYPSDWKLGTTSEDLKDKWERLGAQNALNVEVPAGSAFPPSVLLLSEETGLAPVINWAFLTLDRRNVQAMVRPRSVALLASVTASITFEDGTTRPVPMTFDSTKSVYVNVTSFDVKATGGRLTARDSRGLESNADIEARGPENPAPVISSARFSRDGRYVRAEVRTGLASLASVTAMITFRDGTTRPVRLTFDAAESAYINTTRLDERATVGTLVARDIRGFESQASISLGRGRVRNPGWGFYPPNNFVGDFNGDGKTDIAQRRPAERKILLYLSKGDGFIPVNSVVANRWGAAEFTWVGDFDGDGDTDIASRYGNDSVTMYLPESPESDTLGLGTKFKTQIWDIPDRKWGAYNFTWARDFDGDGDTDIATAGERNIILRLSNGRGFVSSEWTIPDNRFLWSDTGFGPWVEDFDGDGDADIAVLHDRALHVHLSVSTVTGFESRCWVGFESHNWPVGDRFGGDIGFVKLGDFDGDGDTDIASRYGFDSVSMFLPDAGRNTVDLATWQITPGSSDSWGAHDFTWARDFNGDGYTDIASGRESEIRMHLSPGNIRAAATWNSSTWHINESWGDQWWVADFNGDGKADIVSARGNMAYVNLSNSTGTGFDKRSWSLEGGPIQDVLLTGGAVVMATVTQEDAPVEEAEVAFSRSVSGKPVDYKWRGITNSIGIVEIRVIENDPQFWRMGASGYYRACAVDPASGEVLGKWESIPMQEGQVITLSLPIGGPARIEGTRPLPEGAFRVSANCPNPFNPSTQIAYQIPEAGEVSLIVYNALGQEVRRLAQAHQAAGHYRVTWEGKDALGRSVSSGIYLYRLTCNGMAETRRMLLLK